jgi:hypothetical protein
VAQGRSAEHDAHQRVNRGCERRDSWSPAATARIRPPHC